MFTINQRVLYMGHHTWHLCNVASITNDRTVVLIPEDSEYMPFDASIDRCVPVPASTTTIEDMIKYLSKAGNWE